MGTEYVDCSRQVVRVLYEKIQPRDRGGRKNSDPRIAVWRRAANCRRQRRGRSLRALNEGGSWRVRPLLLQRRHLRLRGARGCSRPSVAEGDRAGPTPSMLKSCDTMRQRLQLVELRNQLHSTAATNEGVIVRLRQISSKISCCLMVTRFSTRNFFTLPAFLDAAGLMSKPDDLTPNFFAAMHGCVRRRSRVVATSPGRMSAVRICQRL